MIRLAPPAALIIKLMQEGAQVWSLNNSIESKLLHEGETHRISYNTIRILKNNRLLFLDCENRGNNVYYLLTQAGKRLNFPTIDIGYSIQGKFVSLDQRMIDELGITAILDSSKQNHRDSWIRKFRIKT